MFSVTFSLSNLAEWTPTTTNSFSYFFSSLARSGRVWMQLMQQKVQKSSRTTLPLRSLSLSGPAVFSQAVPPSNSGAFLGGASGWASSRFGPPDSPNVQRRTPATKASSTATSQVRLTGADGIGDAPALRVRGHRGGALMI